MATLRQPAVGVSGVAVMGERRAGGTDGGLVREEEEQSTRARTALVLGSQDVCRLAFLPFSGHFIRTFALPSVVFLRAR